MRSKDIALFAGLAFWCLVTVIVSVALDRHNVVPFRVQMFGLIGYIVERDNAH